MICSSVNLDRFIVRPPSGPDSTHFWRNFRGSRQVGRKMMPAPRRGLLANGLALVAAEIVEDHDIARFASVGTSACLDIEA